jgi:hypothetical protein
MENNVVDFNSIQRNMEVALDAIESGNATKEQIEMVKKSREADNKRALELMKDKEEYLIFDRSGNAFKFALGDERNITIELENGDVIKFDDYINEQIWKVENRNIIIKISSEVKHELWDDTFLKREKEPLTKEAVHEYNIIEVCSIERFTSKVKE